MSSCTAVFIIRRDPNFPIAWRFAFNASEAVVQRVTAAVAGDAHVVDVYTTQDVATERAHLKKDGNIVRTESSHREFLHLLKRSGFEDIGTLGGSTYACILETSAVTEKRRFVVSANCTPADDWHPSWPDHLLDLSVDTTLPNDLSTLPNRSHRAHTEHMFHSGYTRATIRKLVDFGSVRQRLFAVIYRYGELPTEGGLQLVADYLRGLYQIPPVYRRPLLALNVHDAVPAQAVFAAPTPAPTLCASRPASRPALVQEMPVATADPSVLASAAIGHELRHVRTVRLPKTK